MKPGRAKTGPMAAAAVAAAAAEAEVTAAEAEAEEEEDVRAADGSIATGGSSPESQSLGQRPSSEAVPKETCRG